MLVDVALDAGHKRFPGPLVVGRQLAVAGAGDLFVPPDALLIVVFHPVWAKNLGHPPYGLAIGLHHGRQPIVGHGVALTIDRSQLGLGIDVRHAPRVAQDADGFGAFCHRLCLPLSFVRRLSFF
jgi:hypothetical protein